MGRRIALVVGNNMYPDPFRVLDKAVEDASEVAGFLKRRLRFETTTLYNKTAATVTNTLLNLVDQLEDDSQFFFYFAGHGLVVGNAASQSLLCTDATELLLKAVQGAPGAIAPDVLSTISRMGRGDMFFCLDVCRTQTLRQMGGPEVQRGGAGLRSVVNHPVDPATGAAARLVGCRLTLSSCEDGEGANDDGVFATALVSEMERLYDGGYEVKLDQNLVDAIQKRLRLGQKPVLSGTPFVLVPGNPRVEPIVERPQKANDAPKPEPSKPSAPQKTPEELSGQAEAALNAGRFDEAERLANAALELDSSFGWAIWVRNQARRKREERDAEERRKREEREAQERRNRELDQIRNEGWLFLDRGDAATALHNAEIVLKERPKDEAAQSLKRAAEAALIKSSGVWGESSTRQAGFRQELEIKGVKYGFCWIPAGEFDMGSPTSEKDRYNDETLHHVKLTKGYWLLETPVTQRLYEAVMGNNPSYFKGADLPVECVSWDESAAFCDALTKLLPKGVKAKLPTEAQWEMACRAGTKTAYWYGNTADSSKMNYNSNVDKTTPVKSYDKNAWGLYDMHGNVWEWCADYYGDYPTGTVVDPTGPQNASDRVRRGGCWSRSARSCRSANRLRYESDYRNDFLGLRVLLVCD